MIIHFRTLTLQCRKSREVLGLAHQISFFHGKVSSGKSSIARLIDFCLGGNLERTPAIVEELSSVSLEVLINSNEVLLERDADYNSSTVMVTWRNEQDEKFSLVAPVDAGAKSILNDNIYNLSDLIFYLLGMPPLLIPTNKSIEDAKLMRLSIRNFMWYCYLDQDHLDSSFYRLDEPIKQRPSREVIKFVMQYSSQKLIEIEAELLRTRENKNTKIYTAKELRSFLTKFGFSTEEDIDKEISSTRNKLFFAEIEKKKLDEGYIKETHVADDSRNILRKLSSDIEDSSNSILDLYDRLNEQQALRSELISSKFKLARNESVAGLLSGVAFDNCPQCGCKVKNDKEDEECNLCGSHEIERITQSSPESEKLLRLDIDSRIKDIETSIDIHKEALKRQNKILKKQNNLKKVLEVKLSSQLKAYESVFLSNIREIDRKVATYTERLKSQNRLKQMPLEISNLEKQALKLNSKELSLKRDIEIEIAKLENADKNVKDLEATFLNTILTIGLPGISEDDEVHINRKTWDVSVYPYGHEYKKWNFSNAGSGGKKTLFNVCYLLSLHIVAAKNNLPIPSFMIIDTPMKNIDKEVNSDLFKRFYDYLYDCAATILDKTQIILIDNSFVIPTDKNLSFYHRYMTDDDADNPPLISYYRGA